jgi:hypothetical protein
MFRESVYLPELQSFSVEEKDDIPCGKVFVQGDWQFVHSIHFELVKGYGTTVVGVTVLDGETVKVALMGVEGFILFEAEKRRGTGIDVHRALSPFDKPGFAEGLMRDVQTLFVSPSGRQQLLAEAVDGLPVCRYFGEEGQVTDIFVQQEGWNKINIYGIDRLLSRTITVEKTVEVSGRVLPEVMQLTAFGDFGYVLRMKLLNAERIK